MADQLTTAKQAAMAPGQRYGHLLSIGRTGRTAARATTWLFQCDCGNRVDRRANSVRSGHTNSCGCLQRAQATTHGLRYQPEYKIWQTMLRRCQNPKHNRFMYYGGRGITVCERWRVFENFYQDVGPRPSPKHSLDRMNNDGNYEPGNCRWATSKEQANNRRRRSALNA